MNEHDLLTEALNRTDPTERATFLDQACAGNSELRRRLEELLAAYAHSGSPLDRPPVAPAASTATADLPSPIATGEHRPDGATGKLARPDADSTTAAVSAVPSHRTARLPTGEGIGTVIAGRYTLVDVIGEGGMGSVYLAEQTEPVKRQVALKLIKTGMDSRGVLARFDAERQALALMDHPNIARIYDGGLTPAAQPFFVMELVSGVPLTQYCDAQRLTVKARLELFVAVCQAVQHAHQKGIIHRDLKPGNVLVTEVDGRPTPKVIDFGVAKATEVKLTDMSLADVGAIVGTPAYMSPEQADPTSMDIDTRTDVYALGVMLYELLTGSPPLEAKDFQRGAILEMLRMVREVDPPRPSTKLSTADALPNIAANRSIEPARLAKLLQGELDWLVMKALEKDRNRRYDTANAFARDIQRYLADEVVEARPPSRGYRLRKFVKRNKAQVVAASLVLITLLAGIAGTTFGMIRAEKRRQEAERNLAFAKKGNEILGSVFAGLDPKKNYTDLSELKEVLTDNLEKAVKELDGAAIGDPLEVAAMQDTLGMSLVGLGRFGPAIEVLQKAWDTMNAKLGPDHPDTLNALNDLGLAYWYAGKTTQAIALLERARDGRIAKLGPDHLDTFETLNYLAAAYKDAGRTQDAIALFEQVRDAEIAKLGPNHPATLSTLNNLATAYTGADKLPEVIALLERVRDGTIAGLGPDHPKTLATLSNLAQAYEGVGRRSDAIAIYARVRDAMITKLGPDHPSTLVTLNNLALAYLGAERLPEAIPLLERVRASRVAKLGPDNPDTLLSVHNLAAAYRAAGRLPEAIALFENVRDRQIATIGPDHPATLLTLHNLATTYELVGRAPEAISILERVRDANVARQGADHLDTLRMDRDLANAYLAARKFPEAIALYERVRDGQIAKLGPDHPEIRTTLDNLTVAYQNAGRYTDAIALLERRRDAQIARVGPDDLSTLSTLHTLAVMYWKSQQLGKSVPLFEDVLKRQEAKLGRQNPDTLMTVANLGVNYKDVGRIKEAIPLLEEALQAAKRFPKLRGVANPLMDAYEKAGEYAKLADLLRERLPEARKSLPKDSPDLAGMLTQLGLSLLQQKQWIEAEPHLRESLTIREQKEPEDWRTFNTKSALGGALLGQKKYAEAEPLLRNGYVGMKQRDKTIPPQGRVRLPEALDRLIDFYTATSKPDEAKKWQAERAKYPATAPPGKK
ncbi:MAG: tetratricopeptide repeat protein [Isosphaeraceae bacterium]